MGASTLPSGSCLSRSGDIEDTIHCILKKVLCRGRDRRRQSPSYASDEASSRPSSASVARATPLPPVRLPVPVPVSPLVVVCQGEVGLTPRLPQLPSLESSSPQGPPEALSTPVSVMRPRPEFTFQSNGGLVLWLAAALGAVHWQI